jgi:excisionase family DNA binding protein
MLAMSQNPKRLGYSIDEFCADLGIGRTKAYEEIKAGRLKARKLGRRTIVLHKDREAYADALPEMEPS